MAREEFFFELRYRSENLWTPVDIVQHSFIVQNSISPLNLELCQSYSLWDGYSDSEYLSFSHSKEMINTEEKCRKILTKSRSLLYTLHLDLPRDREWSLKSDSEPRNMSAEEGIPHLAKICIYEDFYIEILYDFINIACERTNHKFKVLKWFIKFDALGNIAFDQLPHTIINYFVECMHPGLDDSEFVTESFEKINLIPWMESSHSSEPGRMSNLLYQLHRNRKFIEESNIVEFLGYCALVPSFQHLGDVLKLRNVPVLCAAANFSDNYIETSSYEKSPMSPRNLTRDMSPRRLALLYQQLWVYFNKTENLPAATEFLRLTWNSESHSFLSSDEIAAAFEEGIDPAYVSDIYNFYSVAVGAINSFVEPRSLKHYCRTIIRKQLYEMNIWLPDGIKEIGLPVKLQSYLNLEV